MGFLLACYVRTGWIKHAALGKSKAAAIDKLEA
jgi:hypothetical protein